MGLRRRTDWTRYNLAKERRFMERTAQIHAVDKPCENCAGLGADPGSLHEPDECPVCLGSGVQLAPETVERKGMGTATTAPSDSPYHTAAGRTNKKA